MPTESFNKEFVIRDKKVIDKILASEDNEKYKYCECGHDNISHDMCGSGECLDCECDKMKDVNLTVIDCDGG